MRWNKIRLGEVITGSKIIKCSTTLAGNATSQKYMKRQRSSQIMSPNNLYMPMSSKSRVISKRGTDKGQMEYQYMRRENEDTERK